MTFLTALILLLATPIVSAAEPDALTLLQEADRARGAAEGGITWQVEVASVEGGKSTNVSYRVKVKGVDALAEALEPARNRGELILFNDRNLWFFKPGIKKPVVISARQKLMGQAANGDIASTNYARDYDGKVVGQEKVNGEDCYKLELKAKAKTVTYDGIRYWISVKDRVGVKAEFLTVGGTVFKTATFEYKNKFSGGGKEFPFVSKMTIVSAQNAADQSSLTYGIPAKEDHADSLFNVNNLVR
jgi:hypothetical protein